MTVRPIIWACLPDSLSKQVLPHDVMQATGKVPAEIQQQTVLSVL